MMEQILQKLLSTIGWWKDNLGAVVAAHAPSNSKPTPDQVALESYNYWRTLTTDPAQTFALLGNEQGETSFILGVVGDRGTAFGPFQWHQGRIDLIQKGCGINIKTASHLDQLRAAHWEMTEGSYKHVWPKLIATRTIVDAITVLVHDYEQSGSQASDIAKRTAYAQKNEQKFTPGTK